MIIKINQPTFLFHDYETFGKHPAFDRPAQFASIRTNITLEPISEPEIFFCRPGSDYLPNPEAVLITGITPQKALYDGVIESKFAQRIHQLFSISNTCILGYNNIYFDDEFSRNLFYRNFYEPYDWSWRYGNSRWDLLDVLRACYALRPEGIEWPINSDGKPSFRLEHIVQANNIEYENAHNAMNDVYATLAIAKLIRQKQPKLFNYLYCYRNKHQLKKLINITTIKPLVYISSTFGNNRNNASCIAPLGWHPKNQNILITCDLTGNVQILSKLNFNTLDDQLHIKKNITINNIEIPLKLIHINKCPVLAPASILRTIDADRLGISWQKCMDNLIWLRNNLELQKKIIYIFNNTKIINFTDDVDAQLYDGFFGNLDRKTMNVILKTKPEKLSSLNISFIDYRLEEIFFRYRARNFPQYLNQNDQLKWFKHRKNYFNQNKLSIYIKNLETLYMKYQYNSKKIYLLQKLFEYISTITKKLQ